LHTAFNFDFLCCPWEPKALRTSIDSTLAAHVPVNAPATWVLSNHDVTRPVTRYGRADTSFSFEAKREGIPTDLDLGTRRARAAALLTMALPGSMYIYQGEELGLPEVEDIPVDRRQDPMHFRSGGLDPGRDGCRVPLPWTGDRAPFGFSPSGALRPPWLDQPEDWGGLTVAAQVEDAGSMLALYRAGLRLRRAERALGNGTLRWLPSASTVLAFTRGEDFACVVNFGPDATELPSGAEVLIASNQIEGGHLPADTAVWLRRPDESSSTTEARTPPSQQQQ
jgi:alpha-glucosidase